LAKSEDWVTRLTEEDIDEIASAEKSLQSRNIPVLKATKADFPLPTMKRKLELVHRQLEGGRGFALLRGLPIRQFSSEAAKRIIWGLATHLGYPEPQDKAGSMMHSVTNTGQRVEASDSVRGYQTDDELRFHNDGGDAFMLLCLRTAKEGGVSKLASAGAVFNHILRQRPDLANVLQQPFHFDARAQNPQDKKVQVLPIFIEYAGLLNVLYKRRYINLAQRFDDVPRLAPSQVEALDLLDATCNDPDLQLSFSMEEGDIQIGNNYSILHSRTRYVDHDDPAEKRHLLRVWFTLADGRPLPREYAETREFGPSYLRREQLAQAEG